MSARVSGMGGPMGGLSMGGASNGLVTTGPQRPRGGKGGSVSPAAPAGGPAAPVATGAPAVTQGTNAFMQAANANAGAMDAARQGFNYLNNFEDEVVDRFGQDLSRQVGKERANINAAATRADAFGGSRHALLEGDLNRAEADRFGQFSANLRNQGYRDAAQHRLASAGTLGYLGNQTFNQARQVQNDLASAGAQQQGLNQAVIDSGKNQYQMWRNRPTQSLGTLGAALGLTTPSYQNSTNRYNPGAYDFLSLGSHVLANWPGGGNSAGAAGGSTGGGKGGKGGR